MNQATPASGLGIDNGLPDDVLKVRVHGGMSARSGAKEKSRAAPDTALISCGEPLAPAPFPRLHELASPDTTPRRLGIVFNVVERISAIR